MSEDAPQAEKKLYVDEDWKSQVEAEKEAARNAEQNAAAAGEESSDAEPSDEQQSPLPPASLSFLIGTMYMQGTIALGILPSPVTNKQEFRPEQAKHTIDMLAVLQEKTEGNRTVEESAELEAVLHELRMAYVAVQGQQ